MMNPKALAWLKEQGIEGLSWEEARKQGYVWCHASPTRKQEKTEEVFLRNRFSLERMEE